MCEAYEAALLQTNDPHPSGPKWMQAIDQMVEVSMQTIALEKQQWMDQAMQAGEEAAKAACPGAQPGHHQDRAHRKEGAPGTDTLEVEGEEGDPGADGEASDKGKERSRTTWTKISGRRSQRGKRPQRADKGAPEGTGRAGGGPHGTGM
jgi:hypothetical protein